MAQPSSQAALDLGHREIVLARRLDGLVSPLAMSIATVCFTLRLPALLVVQNLIRPVIDASLREQCRRTLEASRGSDTQCEAPTPEYYLHIRPDRVFNITQAAFATGFRAESGEGEGQLHHDRQQDAPPNSTILMMAGNLSAAAGSAQ